MPILKRIFSQKNGLKREDRLWLAGYGILFGCILIYPLWASSYKLEVVSEMMIFAMAAIGLDFLWGKTGTLNFGQAAFFGLGAYGMGVVTINVDAGYASWLGLFAALGLPGLSALIIGLFLIYAGVRGPYFIIVTMALGMILHQVAISWSSVTGGDTGLIGVPPLNLDFGFFRYEFFGGVPTYLLVTFISAVSLFGLWRACRGHYGRILMAIKDNETRAQTLGYDTSFHLLVVLVVSAMLAGLAGALYAVTTGFVAPDLVGLMLSADIFVFVAVGGRGTLIGPFVGTFLVMQLQKEISSLSPSLWPFMIGCFFVAMVFLFPDGIITVFRWVRNLFTPRQAREASK